MRPAMKRNHDMIPIAQYHLHKFKPFVFCLLFINSHYSVETFVLCQEKINVKDSVSWPNHYLMTPER